MRRRAARCCGGTAAAWLVALFVPAAAEALGLAVSTPLSALSGLQAGSTATASGALTVTPDPTAGWTLSAQDTDTADGHPGHLLRSGAGCTTGPAFLASALSVTGTPSVSGTSSGARSLSSSAQSLATGPALTVTAVNLSLSQVVGSTEALQGGCTYSLTITFTLS